MSCPLTQNASPAAPTKIRGQGKESPPLAAENDIPVVALEFAGYGWLLEQLFAIHDAEHNRASDFL